MGLKLAIITDANSYHALARLTRVELLDYFDLLVAADMTGTKKPDPAHFLFALEALGIKPEESLVVGDSIRRDMVTCPQAWIENCICFLRRLEACRRNGRVFRFQAQHIFGFACCIRALNRHAVKPEIRTTKNKAKKYE